MFGRYLAHGHYFISPQILFFISSSSATTTATTSFIYYVMCLGARFYDYLAPSEVKKKLSSKLVIVTLAS